MTEREKIVEWLRSDANGWRGGAYSDATANAIVLLADEIERGEHLKEDG